MNRARPMAARLKKQRVEQEPRSAHGRAVNKRTDGVLKVLSKSTNQRV